MRDLKGWGVWAFVFVFVTCLEKKKSIISHVIGKQLQKYTEYLIGEYGSYLSALTCSLVLVLFNILDTTYILFVCHFHKYILPLLIIKIFCLDIIRLTNKLFLPLITSFECPQDLTMSQYFESSLETIHIHHYNGQSNIQNISMVKA